MSSTGECAACVRRINVDQATVLSTMKAHFEQSRPPEMLERLEDKRAMELLEESIDVIEFIMHLEDKLGSRIDANEIGPALANMTFGELATELTRTLNEEPPGAP